MVPDHQLGFIFFDHALFYYIFSDARLVRRLFFQPGAEKPSQVAVKPEARVGFAFF